MSAFHGQQLSNARCSRTTRSSKSKDNITELLDSLTRKDQLTLTPTQEEALRIRLAELRVYCPSPDDVHVDRFSTRTPPTRSPPLLVTATYCLNNNIKVPNLAKIFCRACALAKLERLDATKHQSTKTSTTMGEGPHRRRRTVQRPERRRQLSLPPGLRRRQDWLVQDLRDAHAVRDSRAHITLPTLGQDTDYSTARPNLRQASYLTPYTNSSYRQTAQATSALSPTATSYESTRLHDHTTTITTVRTVQERDGRTTLPNTSHNRQRDAVRSQPTTRVLVLGVPPRFVPQRPASEGNTQVTIRRTNR